MLSVCEFNCIDEITSVTKMADELTVKISDKCLDMLPKINFPSMADFHLLSNVV